MLRIKFHPSLRLLDIEQWLREYGLTLLATNRAGYTFVRRRDGFIRE